MRNRSEKILTEVEIGQNVPIPIPNVDRGKGDPRNVMAVVTERVHNGYQLGTSGGMLLGSYTRNQFDLSDGQFLDKETVDKTSEISLRNAFLFVVAKGLPNVGAVQVGNLDVTLKDVRVKRLQCCVTVDVTQTLIVTINKLL
jgi:hypothetical protein